MLNHEWENNPEYQKRRDEINKELFFAEKKNTRKVFIEKLKELSNYLYVLAIEVLIGYVIVHFIIKFW